MRAYDDLIAKYILVAALDSEGSAQPEKEIPLLAPQAADLYFEPGPDPRNESPVFRWLNFITAIPCLLEMYSGTLTLVEALRGPLRKHLEHFQNRCLEAERRDQSLPFLQAQWILTSRRPQQLFAELGCQPLVAAPQGCYGILAPALRLYVVVLPELPRARDTLVLRLLGGLELRREALAEIQQIPADDPDGKELLSLLSYVQVIIDKDPRIPRLEKEEIMLAMRQEFERFKQGLRAEAWVKCEAETIIKFLRARGIAIGDEAAQRIRGCTDPALLDVWVERAAIAQSVDDVLRPSG